MRDNHDWCYRHRVFQRIAVLWACTMTTTLLLAYTDKMGSVTAADGVIISAVLTMATGIVGWLRKDT